MLDRFATTEPAATGSTPGGHRAHRAGAADRGTAVVAGMAVGMALIATTLWLLHNRARPSYVLRTALHRSDPRRCRSR